jgi:hypothetical protein
MYVLDKSEAALQAMGKQVAFYETDDGLVSIRHDGRELGARAFPKDGRVSQAAIVDNKLLGAALQHIKDQQAQRDQRRLMGRLTKRERRLLQQEIADAVE